MTDGTRALRALAACSLALVFIQLLTDGVLIPRQKARYDPGSQLDLRGPYFGALDLRHGEDPYPIETAQPRPSDRLARRLGINRMSTLYAPQALLAYMPLTTVRFQKAKALFLAVSLLALCVSVVLLARLARWPLASAGLALAAFLVAGSSEVVRTLAMGQANAVLLALLAGGVLLLDRKRHGLGGALLALAVLVKPLPAPVFVGLAIRRTWRGLLGGAAAGAALTAASVAAFGWSVHRSYLAAAAELARIPNAHLANQSLTAAWARLLLPAPDNPYVPLLPRPDLLQPLWALSAASLLLVALAVSVRFRHIRPPLSMALWLVLGLLAAPRTLHHYMVWTLLAFVPAFAAFTRRGRWGAVLALAIAFGLINDPERVGILARDGLGLPACLYLSSQTAGLLLLFALLALAHRFEEQEHAAAEMGPAVDAGAAAGVLRRVVGRLRLGRKSGAGLAPAEGPKTP